MRPGSRYANTFDVGFDAFEFVIECGQSEPDAPQAEPHTRVITTPALAKELSRLLRGAVEQYEARFGPLPSSSADASEDEDEGAEE